ncbi:DUF1501 domain-containing protein [Galbitalea soli]|uniref:DUF1501 domain-containing protein n=1 Tax=Galbitalea soli TaxID=1268042 RepID=A0A7C9TQG3_9MICO|nr:DUF1501 domain-containing protein [Galbitalea soli]NEM90720.1 DUF1501 domain-containing protein [Galbitalea soli]NYJ31438.1 uncharacterized protein (DUF1501 family) [Galbitalea soli]
MSDTATVTVADDAILRSLHPDCPDWERLGPTARDAALRAAATAATLEADQRDEQWSRGFNRRTFLKGGLGVGVAALGAQLVTSRVSYAAADVPTTGTLVVVFLRGGMDGLSLLVPAADDAALAAARPGVAVRAASALPFDTARGFGLHPALAPLQPLISAGKVAAVPAVSTPDLSRSHFQAQDCLERGSSSRLTSGWLDRVLAVSGPGTTFRSVAVGGLLPRSMMGSSRSIAMYDLQSIALDGVDDVPATKSALMALYTGVDHPIATQTGLAIGALNTMAQVRATPPAGPATVYPKGNLGDALASLATLIKAQVGVRVACIDVGGWDTHTGMGTVDAGDMRRHLGDLATALAAFTSDLGTALDSTTIVAMSEFGRRVEQNASGGTDHGHGGAVLVLGGGVSAGVHGTWLGLDPTLLDQGDVPGWNDYRDVLSDVVTKRLGLSTGSMGTVFPGWTPTPVGIMA